MLHTDRYLQLDDWWYPIIGPGYGATITWTADPKVFPHGLQLVISIHKYGCSVIMWFFRAASLLRMQ